MHPASYTAVNETEDDLESLCLIQNSLYECNQLTIQSLNIEVDILTEMSSHIMHLSAVCCLL